MSAQYDPYRAPEARLQDTPRASRLRIEGKALVMSRDSELPALCVVTGRAQPTAATRATKKMYWHPSWVYLMLLLNIIVFVIVGLVVRKTATVTYSISPAARADHLRRIWISVGTIVGGLVLLVVGIAGDLALPGLLGALAFLVGLIMLATWARLIWPARIDERTVHVRGIPHDVMRKLVEAAAEASNEPPVDYGFPATR